MYNWRSSEWNQEGMWACGIYCHWQAWAQVWQWFNDHVVCTLHSYCLSRCSIQFSLFSGHTLVQPVLAKTLVKCIAVGSPTLKNRFLHTLTRCTVCPYFLYANVHIHLLSSSLWNAPGHGFSRHCIDARCIGTIYQTNRQAPSVAAPDQLRHNWPCRCLRYYWDWSKQFNLHAWWWRWW